RRHTRFSRDWSSDVCSSDLATVGFKLKIEILSLPFIGIGGLVLIFLGKSPRWVNVSKLLVGFGFLFMGLDYMKNSVEALALSFRSEERRVGKECGYRLSPYH